MKKELLDNLVIFYALPTLIFFFFFSPVCVLGT